MMQPVGPAPPLAATDAKALQQAGQAFEAMLIQKLLASARTTATGAEGEWRQMADQRLAETIAAESPLGIAALLARR